MRRVGQLFDEVVGLDNLLGAFRRAARGKADRTEVRQFRAGLHERLRDVRQRLLAGTYTFGGYRDFLVHDPKERLIQAAPFEQRVVHHALAAVVGPVLERGLIDDCYACRLGKGHHRAVLRAREFAGRFPFYFKLDIERFYDSADHEVLLGLLRARFKDGRLLALFEKLIGSYAVTAEALAEPSDDRCSTESRAPRCALGHPRPGARDTVEQTSASASPGKGLPIGNLTSQYFANFYLDRFDHWAKETWSVPAYLRYMDDMVAFGDHGRLRDFRVAAAEFLGDRLRLTVKHGGELNRCLQGVPFLGRVVYPRWVRLREGARKRSLAQFRGLERRFAKGQIGESELQCRSTALFAALVPADAGGLRRRILCRSRLQGDAPGARTA